MPAARATDPARARPPRRGTPARVLHCTHCTPANALHQAYELSVLTGTQVLLDAAREVFAERGFAESSVADVVERAGSSVGSLYHHFGGKSELFLALWEDWQGSQEQRAAEAVTAARREGEQRPLALFVAGARGFLRGSWEGRSLGSLFVDKDGPPGFELMRRTRGHEWLRKNSLLLHARDDAIGRVCSRLYELNRAVIGDDPDLIRPGQRLRLPHLVQEDS